MPQKKRLREVEENRTTAQDEHNALSHLGLSVLSRYEEFQGSMYDFSHLSSEFKQTQPNLFIAIQVQSSLKCQ